MHANVRFHLITIVLISLLGFSIYANSLNNEFVWDDEYLIEKNFYLKHRIHPSQIFAENLFAGAQKKSNAYRPLQLITCIFNYHFFKLNPRGYHITNILLHILVALSLYCLINLLFGNKLLSLFTSLCFITHPIHTEAVTYISGRADPLATLFLLTAFILYIRYLSFRKIYLYILFLLCYIFSLLSKEIALILPLLLLLYHYTFGKRIKLRDYLFLLGITFGYILLRLTVLNFPLTYSLPPTTLFQRLPGFFVAVTNYLRLLILPLNLHMEYGLVLFKSNNPKAIVGIIILILLFISISHARREREKKLIFFSVAWFLLSIIPVSNLYPLNAYMAEHWLYLPSIAFFLLLSHILILLYRRSRPVTIAIFIILIGFYSSLTIRQNHYWASPLFFYERTLKFNPRSARVYYNLASVYHDKGMDNEAIASAKKAIEINPNYFEARNNLGGAYYAKKMYKEAIIQYKKAIELNPHYPQTYDNLGKVYYVQRLYDKAIIEFKKAIEVDPDYVEAYNNLAGAYYCNKQYAAAVKYCDKCQALGGKIQPDLARVLELYREETN